MHVKTGATTVLLLIRTPDRVTIRNQQGPTIDMTCGPQNAAVSVEYVPAPDQATNTAGEVKAIEFVE